MSFEASTAGDAYAKEARRWDVPKRDGGMRPNGYERYPAMLYKARRRENAAGQPGGPFLCIVPYDEQWSAQNYITVGNPQEEERALSEGWRKSPEEAIAYQNALEDEISNAAAERAQADKRLSEKARAEAAEVDASTFEHVPEIPSAAERKRRGSR